MIVVTRNAATAHWFVCEHGGGNVVMIGAITPTHLLVYQLDSGVRIAHLHHDFAGKSPLALDVKTDKEFIALQMRAIRQSLLEECEGLVIFHRCVENINWLGDATVTELKIFGFVKERMRVLRTVPVTHA